MPFRSTIRGEEVTTGDTGAEARGEPTDGGAAAAIAPRRTSLKDGGEGPPPDFPDGGVSWLQHRDLPRPEAAQDGVTDAGGDGEGKVATGLGVSSGRGLVAVGRVPTSGRGGGGGDERGAIPLSKIHHSFFFCQGNFMPHSFFVSFYWISQSS